MDLVFADEVDEVLLEREGLVQVVGEVGSDGVLHEFSLGSFGDDGLDGPADDIGSEEFIFFSTDQVLK